MQTKPKRNSGAQEKLERKITAINEAIAQFKNKESYCKDYGAAATFSKLNLILGNIDPASQSRNGHSLARIMSRLKIKF